jgi:hypothetical protein
VANCAFLRTKLHDPSRYRLTSAYREKVASFFADSLEAVKQGLSEAYRKSGNQAKVPCLRLTI